MRSGRVCLNGEIAGVEFVGNIETGESNAVPPVLCSQVEALPVDDGIEHHVGLEQFGPSLLGK